MSLSLFLSFFPSSFAYASFFHTQRKDSLQEEKRGAANGKGERKRKERESLLSDHNPVYEGAKRDETLVKGARKTNEEKQVVRGKK